MLYASTTFAKDCFNNAERDYKLDADLLRAIAYRESAFKPNAINYVSPSSYAIGLMQIHSQNFNELSQYGITENHLRQDPCMNIYTGAFYLAKFIRIQGDIWKGVGAYNTGLKKTEVQEQKRNQYTLEVYNIYLKIKENKSI